MTLAKFKNIFPAFLLLLSMAFESRAQQCVQLYPVPIYDCLTGLAYTSYTLGGSGIAPYTYTIVNAVSNATVLSGVLPSIPSGTFAPLPPGNYNIFVDSSLPGCSGSTIGYSNNLPFVTGNPLVTSASVTCFGANNGSAAVVPPTSFSANPGYTWTPGGANTSTVGNLVAGVTYTVTIRDAKGCESRTTVVVSEPPQINSTLASTFITCFGQTLNTLITSTGNVGATTYLLNGSPTVLNNAINLSAGLQTIVTTDSKGCIRTNTVLVTQEVQPGISFLHLSPNCPGGSNGQIIASPFNAYPSYNYTWQPGGPGGSNLTNIPAGTYTCILSYNTAIGNTCTTKSVTVLQPAISPTIIPITNPENCSAADGSYTLNITGVNPPFTFSTLPFGAQFGNTRTNLSSGQYTVLTGYNNTCIDTIVFDIGNLSTVSVAIQNSVPVLCNSSCNASISLNVFNAVLPVTYSANGVPSTTNNCFTSLCAGFYMIRAIDANGCPATTSINLVEPPLLSFSATAQPSVCVGQAVNLQAGATGGTGNYTFIWKPGNIQGQVVNLIPGATTVYSLNAYDGNGCTLAPKQLTVTVAPQISINISSSSSGICPGTTAQITPTISGGDGNYSYTWLPGNSSAASIFVQNITVPVYTLIVKDGCGSPTMTKLININLFPPTKPEFVSKGAKGCEPFCSKFINTTPKSQNAVWSFGDNSKEKKGDTVSYCYLKSGKFDVTLSVVDSNACKAIFSYVNAIEVMVSPESDFITNPEYITIGSAQDVLLRNITEDAIKYQWYVGEKYQGNGNNINYTFTDTGCYKVLLISENKNGCSDTATKYVCVKEDFTFYMPNCFTPNANGLNDVLLPKGAGWAEKNYLFEIYDRWGKRLFFTSDPDHGWDGTNMEKESPFGLYVWKVIVTDIKGVEHRHAGSVTVLR